MSKSEQEVADEIAATSDLPNTEPSRYKPNASDDLALEIVALKLGGYALDACGDERDLGPRRGQAAHDICLWLRKLQGLVDDLVRSGAATRHGEQLHNA